MMLAARELHRRRRRLSVPLLVGGVHRACADGFGILNDRPEDVFLGALPWLKAGDRLVAAELWVLPAPCGSVTLALQHTDVATGAVLELVGAAATSSSEDRQELQVGPYDLAPALPPGARADVRITFEGRDNQVLGLFITADFVTVETP